MKLVNDVSSINYKGESVLFSVGIVFSWTVHCDTFAEMGQLKLQEQVGVSQIGS